MSRPKLDALKDGLAARKTKALLVIRNDKIVYEWYAPGHSASNSHYTASMAKAIVGGVALAVALTDARIALDDRAAKYVPPWRSDPKKSAVTIRQLGSHTSGIEDAEEGLSPHDKLTGWKGDFWRRLEPQNDPFTLSRDKAPMMFKPGEKFQYSNPGIAMLVYATTAALRDAPQKDLRTLLRERIMGPIGVPDREWSIGYGATFNVDGLPLVPAWGGANYTARAVARVGRLMLRKGNWEGTQLLSADAVRSVTSDAGTPGFCGIGWWSNNEGIYGNLPRDAFWGSGAGHQVLLVVPSLNLIAVRNGDALASVPGEPAKYHAPVREFLFEPLIEALTNQTRTADTIPASSVINEVVWAPKETILRTAKGSDNWPMTWGDDDQLYTAYGDGNGFQPFVPEKLSLGLAKVAGSPPDFAGANIRSPSLEQEGDGAAGLKASGIVMVDGILYLWARNAHNSQLAWSTDHGATWEWSHWKFTASFGCPTFLNFGKNYAGALDRFVYTYSPDSESAYSPANGMVLARVAKDKIREREAYEFYQCLGAQGAPVWTNDIQNRGAVFTNEGKCYRSGITYDAPLRRYLWCQIFPASKHPQGPRFQGGFGIFDAPEPWGPWTAAFFADNWDVGPGETSSFPTKWMSADGKTLYLVFSGEDSFSVRKATLLVGRAAPK